MCRTWILVVALLVGADLVLGAIVASEFSSDPVAEGWTQLPVDCFPETSVSNGRYVQILNDDDCATKVLQETDAYTRSVAMFNGVEKWFYEFRILTNGEEMFVANAPATISAGNTFGENYLVNVANDEVKLFRDVNEPVLFFDVEPDVFHTIRMEQENGTPPTYRWYIDSVLVDQGVAEDIFPSDNALIVFSGRAADMPATNEWDYIRFGNIPDDGSADFNSDGEVDEFDQFYISECIDRSAAGETAEPSCTWADINDDNTVDCTDWDAIASSLWTGLPGDPPFLSTCDGAPVPAVSGWGLAVLIGGLCCMSSVLYRRPIKAQTQEPRG